MSSVRELLPHCHHRVCAKHLEAHVITKHGSTRAEMKNLFWKCAKSYTMAQLTLAMEEMKITHPSAHSHLTNATYTGDDGKMKHGVVLDQWTNAAAKVHNWGKLTTSISEGANSAVLRFRRMPPPMLMKGLVLYTQSRIITVQNRFNDTR